MAGENISAEMIKGISLYENYRDMADVDHHTQGNKTAMNIEIDQAYKGKIKGNITLGGGYNSKYEADANLYSFSDKANLFFVGSINNLGKQIFSFEDYISFQGGIEKLTAGNTNTTTLSVEDLPTYLFADNQLTSKEEQFSALNFSYNPSKKIKLNSYIIFDNISSTEKQLVTQTYVLENGSIEQSLENNSDNSLNILNTFVNATYKPSDASVLEYTLNFSPQKSDMESMDIFGQRKFNTERNNDNFPFQQALYFKQRIASFLLSATAFHSIKNNKEKLRLSSNEAFLGLTFQNDDFFAKQRYKSDENITGLLASLSKKISDQVSTKVHYKASSTNYYFNAEITNQNLSNDISTSIFEQQLGISLVDKSGLIRYEIGGNYSFFDFKYSRKTEFLPYINFKFQFKKSHSLSISYNRNIKLPLAKNIINEPYIANYNTLLSSSGLGIDNYAFFDQFGFRYFIYDLFSGTLLSLGGNLSSGRDNLVINTLPNDGYRINTFVKGNESKNLNGYLLLDKKFTKIPFSLRLKSTYSQLQRNNFVNNSPSRITSNNFSGTVMISSNFKNQFFNFETGIRYKLSHIAVNKLSRQNNLAQTEPFVNLILNNGNWHLEIDNTLENYKVDKTHKTFYRLSPELRYSSKNDKWEWFLRGNDILHLDKSQIIGNTAYENYFEEKTVSVLSGYALIGLVYKF